MAYFKNESGNKYGKLFVIKRVTNDYRGKAVWFCKCDCGNNHIVAGIHLRSGSVKSCGCANKFPLGQAALHAVFLRLKNSAKKRNYIFEISEKKFEGLSQKPCIYCGREPSSVQRMKGCNGHGIYNGIDRIDNTKGYTEDNITTCCWTCNRAKGTMPLVEFKEWIKDLIKYNKNKGMGF